MRKGTASQTARSVAARRLEYDRAAAPFGDPAADEALGRDVADGLAPQHNRMHEYIRARTAFFDRAVVHALDRGVTQVVIGAAGYDGRALRYAKPGTRWFEVDHPATQADKRERLDRLGLGTGPVRFIPADFTADPVAAPLRAAGLDPGLPSLFLFEGIVVYLELAVTERVLREFRAVAAPGSQLAVSVSATDPNARTRARFEARVAGYGEPARTTITAVDAAAVLPALGWQLDQVTDRQRSAGLLLARAAAPADKDKPPGPTERTAASPVPPATRARAQPSPGRAAVRPAPPAPDPAAAASPAPAGLPLSALLSQALVAFTIEADNEAERRLPHRTTDHGLAPGSPPGAPWLVSLVMWANCLRHLPDAGLTLGELRDRARTGTNLDGMRRWRYVTLDQEKRAAGTGYAPGTRITPTRWGIAARDTWSQVTGDVESRWRERLGAGPFAVLRAALDGLGGGLDPVLPDCLPVLGYGLFSRPDRGRSGPRPAGPAANAGAATAAGPTPTAGPAAATARAAPPGAGLPLWALLSRPLLACALRYESEPGPSLAVSANVLRVLTESGVPVKDLPVRGGVSRESVAMALGALDQGGLATTGPGPAGGRFRVARLTARGVAARDRYPARVAAVEAGWRTQAAAVRAALEPLTTGDPVPLLAGLTPYPDGWRARSRPAGILPHYPLTLHRGGFPDGS